MGLVRCSGLTSNRANILMLFPEAQRTPLHFSTAAWERGHSKDRAQGMKSMLSVRQTANVFSIDKPLLLVYLKFPVHWDVKSGRLERQMVVAAFLLL